MNNFISFDQMLENLKERDENSKLTIEASEKTVEIVNKIVHARENLGMSQRDLAQKCNIQQPALARIEALKVVPKINTLIKIASAVGVDIRAMNSNEIQQLNNCLSISKVIISISFNNYEVINRGNYTWKPESIVLR